MMKCCLPVAICLIGPTASGKTALAMQLQQRLPVDIISVDSALVYRGMDIGTAKPTPEQQRLAPHYLIDIRDPLHSYSAADFRIDALQAMAASVAAGRIPLLVGGSMLYFKVLLQGVAQLPSADTTVRLHLQQLAAKHGWPALHQQLAERDPAAAERIHPNDSQRLSRALEVCWLTGGNLTTSIQQSAVTPPAYRFWQIALAPADRAQLHQRIEQRFYQIIANGFEQEVIALWQRGDLNADLPAMRCVGYRQMWRYLQGEIDHQQMVTQGICATRQMAKRQMVWLRRWPNLQWLDSSKLSDALQCIVQAFEQGKY